MEIKPLTEPWYQTTLEFLREHFLPFEPCAKAIDLCPLGYRIPALEEMFVSVMRKGLSLAAFHPGTGLMVGVVLLDVKNSNSEPHKADQDSKSECLCSKLPNKFLQLDHFFEDLCSGYGQMNVFQELGADRVLDIFVLATSAAHQGRGVATALLNAALDMAQERDFRAIQCMALSMFTQKICANIGMHELFRIEYADYKQDGKALFANQSMDPHLRGILFGKKI